MIQARGRAAELTERQLLQIHELMLTARIIERRLIEAARAGELPADVFPGVGQEAAMVGLATVLDDGDVFAGSHRDLAAVLARGTTLEQVVLNAFGRAASPSGGCDGSIGFAVPERNLLMIEPYGPGNHQVAVGCALAITARAEARVVMVHCGEGATAEGSWHEAVNLAAVHGLPVVFAVETNGFAGALRSGGTCALEYIAHRADGYGVPGIVVDGTDVLDCIAAAGEAVDRARRGGGPTVVEAVSFRRSGHTATEDGSGDPDEAALWEGRDPIDRFEEYLGVRGLLDEQARAAAAEHVERRVAEVVEWARRADSGPGRTGSRVFAEARPEPGPAPVEPTATTVRDALHRTLDAEMGADERIVVIGRDVAAGGGSHGVTEGLAGRFGPTRVFDVPGGAATLVGTGLGAAVEGLRPVVEIPDSRSLGEAARLLGGWGGRHHWKTGHPVPLVVRVPCRPGATPPPEAILPPGVKVVAVSDPETASGLLAAAIRDPNPVILLEPIRLYPTSGPAPGTGATTSIGAARTLRRGEEVTLVAWGAAVAVAVEACDLLPAGSVEVIDLLALAPIDWATVLESVERTSRLVVLDEAAGGVGGEVAGRVAAEAMWSLDAPVVRLTPSSAGAPFSPIHGDGHILTPVEVAEAVRSLTST